MADGIMVMDTAEARIKASEMKTIAQEIESLLNDMSKKIDEINNVDTGIYQGNKRPAVLADSVEAVIAAMYMDSNNIEICRKFIIENLKDAIEEASLNVGKKDYKTVLQEKLQEHGDVKIEYVTIREDGPDHNKTFTVELHCNSKKLSIGQGTSKKNAEIEAARIALEKLK